MRRRELGAAVVELVVANRSDGQVQGVDGVDGGLIFVEAGEQRGGTEEIAGGDEEGVGVGAGGSGEMRG